MYMFALPKTIGKGPNYPPGSFYAADLYPDQRLLEALFEYLKRFCRGKL